MSRFRDEMSIIPSAAWVIAFVFAAAAATCVTVFLNIGLNGMETMLIAPVVLLVGVFFLLVGYVYADAKRRNMRYVVWTLLAMFIPNGLGILLYFLLRDPLPRACASCGAPLKPGFGYCTSCGAATGDICPQCKRPTQPGWRNCPNCGAPLV